MKFFLISAVFISFLVLVGCQKKEVKLLDSLNQNLKAANGDVAKAKENLKTAGENFGKGCQKSDKAITQKKPFCTPGLFISA